MNKNFGLKKDKTQEVRDMSFEKDGDVINIMDIPPDPDILRLVREYDAGAIRKKQTQRRKSFVHIAALVLICVVTVSAVTLESSDALRMKVYRFFSNNRVGAATFLAEDEYDLIGDWEDYWYPTYLPEGFIIKGAERTQEEKIMLFSSENGKEIRILEYPMDAVTSIDIDSTSMEEVTIQLQPGYIFANEEHGFGTICWTTDDRQISIEMTGDINKDILIRIAENLTHIE